MKHVQKGGEAYYDEEDFFLFAPDNVKRSLDSYRASGIGQLSADGTFEFTRTRRKRADSELIMRTNHCRLSHTKDNAIQLTCKVYDKEQADAIALLRAELETLFNNLNNQNNETEQTQTTQNTKNVDSRRGAATRKPAAKRKAAAK